MILSRLSASTCPEVSVISCRLSRCLAVELTQIATVLWRPGPVRAGKCVKTNIRHIITRYNTRQQRTPQNSPLEKYVLTFLHSRTSLLKMIPLPSIPIHSSPFLLPNLAVYWALLKTWYTAEDLWVKPGFDHISSQIKLWVLLRVLTRKTCPLRMRVSSPLIQTLTMLPYLLL